MSSAVINASRLREARLYRRMTMEELADSVGINKQAISQFENSKTSPEPFTLKRIADVLDFPYSFFAQRDTPMVTGNTYFRALYSSSRKDLIAQELKTRYLAQIFVILKEKLIVPSLDLPSLPERSSIEEIAQYVRKAWDLNDYPITNMVALLEQHGVVVGEFATEGREIDAFYQYNEINKEAVYCVVLGTDKSSFFRRQFNCAHELGHILLHERYEDLGELSREDYRKREDQANAFAAAFLMPSTTFGRDVSIFPNRLSHYVELKRKWGVSMAAMIMRARSLDMITPNQYTYLMRQMSSKGYRTLEPLDLDVKYRHPKVLRQSVEKLIESNTLTGHQLLQYIANRGLSLSPSALGELLNMNYRLFEEPVEESNILLFPSPNR